MRVESKRVPVFCKGDYVGYPLLQPIETVRWLPLVTFAGSLMCDY
jgi:hypothetical protein